jgi:hypothetical protein
VCEGVSLCIIYVTGCGCDSVILCVTSGVCACVCLCVTVTVFEGEIVNICICM